ncbi:unnamed protein product [Acanthoscelides obtectus]|uniref:Microsomal glutathione S-transferase 1 n=1 Tax=Acanthoscelides obtectus TaxID=200917 RepID=A0A9P0M3J0_ACAOB|nr:unnamed protein product [Acanthoscelides obtectus]CAK1677312.1 Microsomal glutathione S-transferase 1 [Acanthoscelides obtectus]
MYTLNINNVLIETWIFYTSVLFMKTILMIPLTGWSRIYYRVPMNPEDVAFVGEKVRSHEKIERYRRAHLNDLENIPFFVIISFLYLLTNPSVNATIMMFRIYTITRIAHTITYCFLESASRILLYQPGAAILFYMTYSVAKHFI